MLQDEVRVARAGAHTGTDAVAGQPGYQSVRAIAVGLILHGRTTLSSADGQDGNRAGFCQPRQCVRYRPRGLAAAVPGDGRVATEAWSGTAWYQQKKHK
ncbi:hypothetical protein [Cupriavidus taiwanensis]|uniref:hypothetical protein n=1 Tax=Cupriavidus taiwanensis TaxID=164546 RepID=UPI000E2F85C2|nr:hypothetical protein [Cupriavidus taiwanensis]